MNETISLDALIIFLFLSSLSQKSSNDLQPHSTPMSTHEGPHAHKDKQENTQGAKSCT